MGLMNEQYSFSIYQWTIVFALFVCMKSLIDKDKDEIFVYPSIYIRAPVCTNLGGLS